MFRREHSAIHQENQLGVLLEHIAEVVIGLPLPILPEHPDLGELEGLGLGGQADQITRTDVYAFLFTLHVYQ